MRRSSSSPAWSGIGMPIRSKGPRCTPPAPSSPKRARLLWAAATTSKLTSVTATERFVYLRRARDLIDRRYAEPLDLAVMAGEAGFSRYHFARCFKDAYGETPAAYL